LIRKAACVLTLFSGIEDVNTGHENPGRIYSLLVKEARAPDATNTDLSTLLRLNNPSQAENKLRNSSIGSNDPVIDHLMDSKAFKLVHWGFIVCVLVLAIPWTLSIGNTDTGAGPSRLLGLQFGLVVIIPFNVVTAAVAMACSRRLR
jgi:hypothetical protein